MRLLPPRLVAYTLWLGLGFSVALTVGGLLAPVLPPLEMANHFRLFIILDLIGLFVFTWLAGMKRLRYWSLALLTVNAGLLSAPLLLSASPAADIQSVKHIKIVTFNVWGHNRRLPDVAAFLGRQNADVVLLQELPPRNAAVLLPLLKSAYPHQLTCNCRNQALLSKVPWIESGHAPATDNQPGTVWARFADAQGKAYRVQGLHPAFPFRPWEQSRHYAWLRGELATIREPLIVAGDFNMTPWSYSLTRLTLATGLRRHGTFRTSWSGQLPLQTFLIDNVLTSPDIRGVSFRTGPRLGSDHLPVIATVQLP